MNGLTRQELKKHQLQAQHSAHMLCNINLNQMLPRSLV